MQVNRSFSAQASYGPSQSAFEPHHHHIHEGYADAYQSRSRRHTQREGFSVIQRLQMGVKNALNGKNLRKSFFKSLFMFLLTLPTAAIIPGPQIAVIPAAMGIGAGIRFFKGILNPEKVAHKLNK
jgi:hypothetical protein